MQENNTALSWFFRKYGYLFLQVIDLSKKITQEKSSENEIESTLSLTSGIGARILEAVDIVGGKKELSRKANISASQLYRIISEDNQAKIETIAAIAQAADISIEWLATGQSEKSTLRAALEKDGDQHEIKDMSHHRHQVAEPKADYQASKVLVDQSFIDGLLARQAQLMDKQIQLMDQLQAVRDQLQKAT